MKHFFRTYRTVLMIVLLAGVLRFALLDRIPTAITGDELIYPTTAKAVFLTGHDITGTWNPLSIFAFRYPPGELQAELPYFIHLIANSFLPFSLLSYRIPFALLSCGIVILIYLIANKLFGHQTAIITGVLAAINPWLIVMGRTGYEITPATFFYLLGLYIVIRDGSKKLIWAIPAFFLAFYSYIGTKIIFIPFIFLSILLSFLVNKKIDKKQLWYLGVVSLLFVGFFISQITLSGKSRLSDILLPNAPIFSQKVDSIRKISIQSPLLSVMVNKYTVFGENLIQKTLRVFSSSYLFAEGDNFFLQARHSFFYPIDSIVFLFGIAALFTFNPIICLLIVTYTALGAVPHILHRTQTDFSAHLALLFPFIVLIIGFGISYLYGHIPQKFRKIGLCCMTVIYAASLGNFILVYFYQLPMQGAGDFHMRTLSKYLTIAKQDHKPIIVYSTQSGDILRKYVFYSNSINTTTIPQLAHPPKPGAPILFDDITFESCNRDIDPTNTDKVYIVSALCGFPELKTVTHTKISRISDGGTIFDIYNNTVCNREKLSTYPNGIALNDFAIEAMETEDFCTTFISR